MITSLSPYVIEYLFSSFESALFFNFLTSTLKKRERVNSFIYIGSIVLFSVIMLCLSKIIFLFNIKLIIIALTSLCFTILLYKGSLKNKILFTIMFFVILVLCDVVLANALCSVMGVNARKMIFKNVLFNVSLFCISKLKLFIILKIISRFINKNNLDIPPKYCYISMSILSTSLAILMVIDKISTLSSYYEPIYFVVLSIGILIINAFAHYIFLKLIKYHEKEILYNTIQIKNETMEKYYKEKEKNYQETRKLRHDFKNHILCISSLLENNNVDEAQKYIKSINKSISPCSSVIKSGNNIADAVLNQKLGEAKHHNIDMEVSAVVPKEIRIESIDLCAILSNTIDNAIEASMNIDDEVKRKINVKINPYKNYLHISVSNQVCTDPLIYIKKFRSTKKDSENHGLGTKIIQNIVEIYNGFIEYKCENTIFTVKILVLLKE